MTDARTMAYINMYAVLGTLENLCELDSKAKEIISKKDYTKFAQALPKASSATKDNFVKV